MEKVVLVRLIIFCCCIQLTFCQSYEDCLLTESHHNGHLYREYIYNDEFKIFRIYTHKRDRNHHQPYNINFKYDDKGKLVYVEYTDKTTRDVFKIIENFYLEDKLIQQRTEYRYYGATDFERKPNRQYHKKVGFKEEQLISFEYDLKGQLLSTLTQHSEKNQSGTHFIFEKGKGWETIRKSDLLWETKKWFFINEDEKTIEIELQGDKDALVNTKITYGDHRNMVWEEFLHFAHEFNPVYIENYYEDKRYENLHIENKYDDSGKLVYRYVDGVGNFTIIDMINSVPQYKLDAEETTTSKSYREYIYSCN